MSSPSRCAKCGQLVEPHSPAAPGCTVCVRFTSLAGNARRVRRGGSAPGLEMTLEVFAAWFVQQPRRCMYCTIPERLLPHLGVRTQVGHLLQRLGVDRLDSTQPYRPGNIGLCCFACNKVKSNTFTTSEMTQLGLGVAAVWRQRLAAIGILGAARHWAHRRWRQQCPAS